MTAREPQDAMYYRYWLGRINEHGSLRITSRPAQPYEIHTSIGLALVRLGYADRHVVHKSELVLTDAGRARLVELTGPDPYPLAGGDLAGFDIIGVRQPDGTIRLGSGATVDEFPSAVAALGLVWTLEAVRENDGAETDEQRAICWGVYV